MKLKVVKQGNSLLIPIPASYARSIGLKAGDSAEFGLTVGGGLAIRPPNWDRKAFLRELVDVRKAMRMGTSVTDELRRDMSVRDLPSA